MQEISNAIIEFFDLVIEKYITHFANPKREWSYFKSLIQSSNIDLNRIQTYLKVLKNSTEKPTYTKPLELMKRETVTKYVSPLRDENYALDNKLNHRLDNGQVNYYFSPRSDNGTINQYLSQPRQDNTVNYQSFKNITQKVVNLMDSNNIQFAITQGRQQNFECRRTSLNYLTLLDKFPIIEN
ncbi:unnamed protein product (macronuclear) [Paramecium tetraurelia]|uniref:Uncharacterized protein n=1 Tax=Paramecium tetraurelia TaxID=5888 RepID=A0BSG2_PARTE|nr:uncharacterized protein GSPATT00031711001 [Paramecium tetraurelia]CAK61479.1 unnamed protein product [Paramecium tetraurelia]|eukprot:XP_001428877.1 hypothetical protein (macronuclear) [Paramecium tetraurelia strain d4-2]